MPELPFSRDWQACRDTPLCAHPALKGIGGQPAIPDKRIGGRRYRKWVGNVQSNNYWSSTTNANNTDNAWNVNMWNGNVNNNNKDNDNYVWPVRSGEWLTPIFSFENLYKNYLACRRHKRNTINALKFEIDAEENLFTLSRELQRKTYSPSRSVCFVVKKPKMREIIAADFRDRVVHHLLVKRLELIYEKVFVHDSYACRQGKGLHKAISRLRDFIRKGSRNGTVKLYFLHLDIQNFFMTIDKDILYSLLARKVKDPELLRLSQVIIFNDPVRNCILKGKKGIFSALPPHKSLFSAPEGKGLPIGNLTSQFFANVYLNELDQYVKHTLKCTRYIRYCDDCIILDKSPERLEQVREEVARFVTERLALSLNWKYRKVSPVENGIDFLGYIVRPEYTLVRRRVVNNLKEKLRWFEKRLISEKDGIRTILYNYDLLERLRSVLASYFGHLKWADTYNLRQSIITRFHFLWEYFDITPEGLRPLYQFRKAFYSIDGQYCYYRSLFTGHVIFFQFGYYYRQYNPFQEGLSMEYSRVRSSFPLPASLVTKWAAQGVPVVIINEIDGYIGTVKERQPAMKIIKKRGE